MKNKEKLKQKELKIEEQKRNQVTKDIKIKEM